MRCSIRIFVGNVDIREVSEDAALHGKLVEIGIEQRDDSLWELGIKRHIRCSYVISSIRPGGGRKSSKRSKLVAVDTGGREAQSEEKAG